MNKKTKSTQEPTTNNHTIRVLSSANYSFDTLRNAWFRGKKPVNEEDVLVWLIRYAKSQNVPNAGEWAIKALESAKHTPELTTGAFVKARMVRNRNRRIAGKYLFQNWARAVGIEIVGSLEDFMRWHSLVVARFYNEIARGFACCKKQARIAGRVMRSVFIGWDLRDEEAEFVWTSASRLLGDDALLSRRDLHTIALGRSCPSEHTPLSFRLLWILKLRL